MVLYFYVLRLLNGMLAEGVLAEPWSMGTPALILLHTGAVLLLLGLTWRGLFVNSGGERDLRDTTA